MSKDRFFLLPGSRFGRRIERREKILVTATDEQFHLRGVEGDEMPRKKREVVAKGASGDMEIPTRKNGLANWAAEDSPFAPEDKEEKRTKFKHDSDEVIYSAALRRLSDKSQVVVKPERIEHFRSRLTHTLEVNQIAESIGVELKLDLQLINAIAFGHDIGHAPFGHAGEQAFQEIMRSDVLPLCDVKKLRENLKKEYDIEITFKPTGECENRHWLFHHAMNSVRTIQRKLEDVTPETMDGIRMHSWSPWQIKVKFDIPTTYEAQVVAIADQVAGINHDTEDILTCKEVGVKTGDIRGEVPQYVAKNTDLEFGQAKAILDAWFLKEGEEYCNEKKGWGRKYRLRKIINSVVEVSKNKLLEQKVDSAAKAADVTLDLDKDISDFLGAYEKYIREEKIQKLSWFKQRDAQAAAGIWAVYNFFKHYTVVAKDEIDRVRPSYLQTEIKDAVDGFTEWMKGDKYGNDRHCSVFTNSAVNGKNQQVEHIMHTIDYVAGMTDHFLMKNYDLAFNLFK